MTTINKNLLRAIQNNSLTSVDTQKEPGLVNDCHDTSQKRTSFDSELSEVKNVTKSLSNMVRVGTTSSLEEDVVPTLTMLLNDLVRLTSCKCSGVW